MEPSIYGLWRLQRLQSAGYVVLAVGEADTLMLWQHNIPALGLPAAAAWQESWAKDLLKVGKIFIPIDSDERPASWDWLEKSSICRRVNIFSLEACKEVHRKDPTKFPATFMEALAGAMPLTDEQRLATRSASPRRSQATQLLALWPVWTCFILLTMSRTPP